MNKSVIKDALKLVAITLVAALLLSLVYQLTKDKIAQAEAAERMESFYSVLEKADSFAEIDSSVITSWNNEHPGAEVLEAYTALDSEKKVIGVVVSAVSHNGYGGDIVLSLGVENSGAITGVKVTSMSETSGLGAHCQDEDWVAQFGGKNADKLTYVKNGDPGENEIDAITSATITTKAVLEAVNQGADFAKNYLGGEGR